MQFIIIITFITKITQDNLKIYTKDLENAVLYINYLIEHKSKKVSKVTKAAV